MPTALQRITVDEYHQMIADGVLTEDDRVELLDGHLVEKMPHDPLHDGTIQKTNRRLTPLLPAGWELRVQMVVSLGASEPEPDLAIVREDPNEYLAHHPGPSEIGAIIEVANTSLDTDREDKLRISARAGVPIYWIVDVVNRAVEVYELPSGPSPDPSYGSCSVYRPGDSIPLALAGVQLARVQVADFIK
ncbi:MAG TPA: Uma2 family endonuclease [Urbifossiella sp.]|nr:Uma2 family endonuclease [Urbifossiella sp.]